MTLRMGSLFSGYEGLGMGVRRVFGDVDLAWYSEIDKHACTVLAAHHPGVPNLGDITTVDWASVPPVDILTGGYPCQPFSHAGQRKGTNDERHLWPHVRDALVALRPMVAIFENVDGHRSLGLDVVLGDLASLGMSARWLVVRAADAGAPHSRKRVFIVVTADADGAGLQGHADTAGAAQAQRHGHAVEGTVGPAADAADIGHERRGEARRRRLGLADDDLTSAHPDRDGHGRELHARAMGSLEGEAAGGAPERQRPRGVADAGGDIAATDAAGAERRGAQREHLGEAARSAAEPGERAGAAADADGNGHAETRRAAQAQEDRSSAADSGRDRVPAAVEWGRYAPAIARWELVLGRPAPAPTVPGVNGRPRLSPVFVEWMMGLPEGHVTGHGLKPAACLKMLGNGVVPQQAELALRMLLADEVAA